MNEPTTANERLTELARMGKQSGQLIFLRAKYATELLDDKLWIDQKHEGSIHLARQWLQQEYFPDLHGSMELFQLERIYRWAPYENIWQRNNYNLKLLWNACLVAEKQKAREQTKAVTLEKSKQKKEEGESKPLSSEIESLKRRIEELEKENTELTLEVMRLEKILRKSGLWEECTEEELAAS